MTGSLHLDGLKRDTIVLGWEDRRKSRQRVKTSEGSEIALAFSTGTVLREGDILFMDDHRYIAVEATKEDIITIYPENMEESALVAYEIGNRHLPVSIAKGKIMTIRNAPLEELLKKRSARFQFQKEIFEPHQKGHSHD